MRSTKSIMKFNILFAIIASIFGTGKAFASNNNVCQLGAPTKSAFMHCYNNDAAARALYNSLGITAGGIQGASSTTICATQGYTSYGRHYTAGSTTVNPDGQRFFRRPLSSVMHGCATAWKVQTKNGAVMVLKFCGNPETKGQHRAAKKHTKKCGCKVKKHTKKCGCKVTTKVPPSPPVAQQCIAPMAINAAGFCVSQSNASSEAATVTQDCKAQTIWNGSQCVSYITQVTIPVNANCSQVVFMNGDSNVVFTHDSICSSTTTTVTPPPSCNCTPQCPAGTTGTFPNCQVPPVTCPSGSTPSTDGKTCVKNGTPPNPVVSPAPGSNPTPVGTVGSNQCYWDHAGTYNGHQHASGDAVSSADFVYAGNLCPTGASDFS